MLSCIRDVLCTERTHARAQARTHAHILHTHTHTYTTHVLDPRQREVRPSPTLATAA